MRCQSQGKSLCSNQSRLWSQGPSKPMEWQPRPEPAQRTQPMMAQPSMPQAMPPVAPQMAAPPDFGMPPIEQVPPPDFDLEEPFGLDEEPKKKGLFGMFKK